MKKKAVISVFDKTGAAGFARGLVNHNYEILSTGGTYRLLKDEGIPVTEISSYTGFPEIMNGRVKTLHPRIHGGILAVRDDRKHMEQAADNGIELIDIIAVNLYPFAEVISRPDVTLEEAVENIDIGGPAMLRSAAKNHRSTTVLCDPADYQIVLDELPAGICEQTRRRLAVKVFGHTAAYDQMINIWLSSAYSMGKKILLSGEKGVSLRYGENPHQKAVLYYNPEKDCCGITGAEILHGKEMSYNNYIDGEAALETVKEFINDPAVCIIKHSNPCGLATGKSLVQAFSMAWEGDVVSAFGSVIACSRTVDAECAVFLKGKFAEALIAPDFTPEALNILRQKKDLRLLKLSGLTPARAKLFPEKNYRFLNGGILEQDADLQVSAEMKTVTEKKFPDEKIKLAEFAFKAVKRIKSNAIAICHEYEKDCFMLLGMGAGQPNRVDAVRKLSAVKAQENIARLFGSANLKKIMGETVLASDAYFPFPDNITEASSFGIKYIAEPGGSMRDQEVIEACNKEGVAMIFTGMRHFLH
ncbi:MAG: bifunctional phosphoribosylaminoimidazolecarboxamide formyltransferase/IMP cyclohydrolase [Spirochaetes bacterium GWF1_41_5]|nr:MAG: bifunctional phosphoribosylaminoimidazolecarboxamide formyltransferase/IMP cyclohydrolase [Spirochaetes bacterium GWF1_41_5]HBE00920.1 bifunctional phosphoribosylaminoimidazolecarboxamide formyltransferase/IMP cyclohydrolase PurH [Spirochaetia bacterium]